MKKKLDNQSEIQSVQKYWSHIQQKQNENKLLIRTVKPSLYRVILLNTQMISTDFVIHVFQHIFHKDYEEAKQLALQIRCYGFVECGVFTYEIAEEKVSEVADFAENNLQPLKCVIEKR